MFLEQDRRIQDQGKMTEMYDIVNRDLFTNGSDKMPLSKSDDDNKPLPAVPSETKPFKRFRNFEEAPIEVRTFGGFKDFTLDLTCLSPPPSPPPSIYKDARSITPSASTSPRSPSPALSRQSHAKSASSLLPTPSDTPAIRGSWPLSRYVGRGTPIDKSRRMEWSATNTECGDVGEDGVLLSMVRSTSLDSTAQQPPPKRSGTQEWKYNILDNLLDRPPSARPPRNPQLPSKPSPSPEWKYNILDNLLDRPPMTRPPPKRAVSPEWNLNILDNLLDRPPSTFPKRSRSLDYRADPPPPSLAIEIEGAGKPGEWSTFMQTVLGGSNASAVASTPQLHQPFYSTASTKPVASLPPTQETTEPVMTPEEIRELDTGLDIDFYSQLDLGLGEGIAGDDDETWLHSDVLHDPTSGRESPSVYSLQAPSTQPSRVPSVITTTQDARSTASIKMEEETVKSFKAKSTGSAQVWWRRVLSRLKRIPFLASSH